MDDHPRVRLARAEYEESEQQLRHEIRKQYPDLTIGPSYSLEEGFSRMGMGFGMPIPLWNRNRRAIAEAAANRDAARINAEVVVETAMGELAREEARLAAAQALRALLNEQVAPLVDQQVRETRDLLGIGEIDVLVLRHTLSTALETKTRIVDATLAGALAANNLENMLQPTRVSRSRQEVEEVEQ